MKNPSLSKYPTTPTPTLIPTLAQCSQIMTLNQREERETESKARNQSRTYLSTPRRLSMKCRNWRSGSKVRASLVRKQASTEKRSRETRDLKKSSKWLIKRKKSHNLQTCSWEHFRTRVCSLSASGKRLRTTEKPSKSRPCATGLISLSRTNGSEIRPKRFLMSVFCPHRQSLARKEAKRRCLCNNTRWTWTTRSNFTRTSRATAKTSKGWRISGQTLDLFTILK